MEVHTTQATDAGRTASDPVIPAVRGEFYKYSSVFSVDRPLGFLMKCRANKGRPLTDAEDYAHELDLAFVFGNGVRVCSPNAAPSIELLGALVVASQLNQTWITRAGITEDAFYQLRQQKDGHALAQVCRIAIAQNDGVVLLFPGTMLAVATESGKYGLLLVKEITPSSVEVDACHILL